MNSSDLPPPLMPELKHVPYGLAAFETLREAGFAYVDKTRFIHALEEADVPFSILLRPRRFGKSLFANMLAAYYDKAAADDFEKNFAGTWIAEHPTPTANKFLVLKFDLSGIGGTEKTLAANFMIKLKDGMWQFVLRYLSGNAQIEAVLEKNHEEPSALLTEFLTTVQSLMSDRIYLIIDEYDHLGQKFFSEKPDLFKTITGPEGFLTEFYAVIQEFSRLLIARAFITGVTSISQDALSSRFKLATDISNAPAFATCTGFTEDELRKLIPEVVDVQRCGRSAEDILARITALYEGYRFSPESAVAVLNSSMCLYYLSEIARRRSEPPVLLDPSFSNDLSKIEGILFLGRPDFTDEIVLKVLFEKAIPFRASSGALDLNADGELTREGVLSFLVFMGFLTPSTDSPDLLVCPNPVLKEVFFRYWFRRLSKREDLSFPPTALKKAVEGLKAGEAEPLLKLVSDRLSFCFAGNADAHLNERTVLLAVSRALCTQPDYRVSTVENADGAGCARLILQPRVNPDAAAWVIEFKVCESSEEAPQMATTDVETNPNLRRAIAVFSGSEFKACRVV